jgi:hypothetical protein
MDPDEEKHFDDWHLRDKHAYRAQAEDKVRCIETGDILIISSVGKYERAYVDRGGWLYPGEYEAADNGVELFMGVL